MIHFSEPPTLDKAKPLTIGHVIASQVGMPPANFGVSQARAAKPATPAAPNPHVMAAKAAYINTKLAETKSESSARNILNSWFGVG
jgi:hypothetical protein